MVRTRALCKGSPATVNEDVVGAAIVAEVRRREEVRRRFFRFSSALRSAADLNLALCPTHRWKLTPYLQTLEIPEDFWRPLPETCQ